MTKYIGYWDRTWEPSGAPAGTSLGIAFSGWTNPVTACEESAKVKDHLVGEKYISIGGGNENGALSNVNINEVISAINGGQFSGYDGIAFDVEECVNEGMSLVLSSAFKTAKENGFKVLVTVSHAAPYGCVDAKALMESFFSDENIDILSPQLYTTGEETKNDYTENMGVTWGEYAQAKAAVVPSIVQADLYQDAEEYFKGKGVSLQGFIQWGAAV